jgi:hypothetical protein
VSTRSTLEVDLEGFQESKNLMIHSWPGQGKTVWATGAPNCSLFSAEPGAISAKLYGRKGVGLVRIKEWADAVAIRQDVERGKFDHRTWLIIDTISSLQVKNQNSVLDKAVAENPRRDPDIPAIQDYQKQQNSLKRWVEFMVDYPINTIWLAHTLRIEDQDGGAMFIPTILGGADKGYPVANYVMGLMNAVGYMEMRGKTVDEKKTMVRRILWQPYHDEESDTRYVAKDHFGAFGRFTDDLDFPGHMAMIEAKQAESVIEDPEDEPPVRTRAENPNKKAAPRRRVAANA